MGRRGRAAGWSAVAELLQAGNRRHRGLPAGALQRRAIGKMLLAGALQRRAIGKMLLARAPQWQRCWLARGAVAELLAGSRRKALRHKKRE